MEVKVKFNNFLIYMTFCVLNECEFFYIYDWILKVTIFGHSISQAKMNVGPLTANEFREMHIK